MASLSSGFQSRSPYLRMNVAERIQTWVNNNHRHRKASMWKEIKVDVSEQNRATNKDIQNECHRKGRSTFSIYPLSEQGSNQWNGKAANLKLLKHFFPLWNCLPQNIKGKGLAEFKKGLIFLMLKNMSSDKKNSEHAEFLNIHKPFCFRQHLNNQV